jgi:hypothetical protein
MIDGQATGALCASSPSFVVPALAAQPNPLASASDQLDNEE